jgi:hypothetical protein
MRRLRVTWVVIALFICPSVCTASYLIQLNNGKQFFISDYWEEGNLVKFYYYGGVVSIEKGQISTITSSDSPYIEVQPPPSPKPKPTPTLAEEKAEEGTATVKKEETEEAKKLLEEFQRAKELFDSSRYILTYDQLFEFSEQLSGLRNEFVGKGLLDAYRDKVVEILAMEEQVREILSQRRQ